MKRAIFIGHRLDIVLTVSISLSCDYYISDKYVIRSTDGNFGKETFAPLHPGLMKKRKWKFHLRIHTDKNK